MRAPGPLILSHVGGYETELNAISPANMRGTVDESAFAARVASETSKMVDVDNEALQRHGAGSAPCLCEVSGPTATIFEFSAPNLAESALQLCGHRNACWIERQV